jgi:hypothetical protein
MMPVDPEFFTARQLRERYQLKTLDAVYALPIRRIKVGRFVRFPRKAVEQYENRGYELPRQKESA